MSDYPNEIGVAKFNDGTYDVYPESADIAPSVKYVLAEYMEAELTRLREENWELAGLLGRYVNAYPAFRIKPIGADGSVARIEQEMLTALEEKAQAALAKPASTAQSAASAVDHNKGSME